MSAHHDIAVSLVDSYRATFESDLAAVVKAGKRLADSRAASPDVDDIAALRDVADSFMAASVSASFFAMACELERETDPQVVRIRELLASLPDLPAPHLTVVA